MFDLAILGGGPAGYTAAERAAAGGLNVVLFEKIALGGTCLNEGCIPTKTLLYSSKLYYNAKNGAKYGVTAGDVYAVLANLGPVLAELMNEGRSVRLKGVGTFFLTCSSQGAGVDSPEEVTSRQITAARVRFIPEYSRTSSHAVVARTIVPRQVQWVSRDRTSE